MLKILKFAEDKGKEQGIVIGLEQGREQGRAVGSQGIEFEPVYFECQDIQDKGRPRPEQAGSLWGTSPIRQVEV